MKTSRVLPFLFAAALFGCSETTRPSGDNATLRLTAVLSGTAVDLLVVTVSASDIPTALVFNIPVVDGTASGTLHVPPGSARTILVEAFDEGGEVTHDGSATVDVQRGQNPPVSIALRARAGQVPIVVTIADFTVQVTPSAETLSVGQSAQLTATIIGPDSAPQAGTISWATTNPAFATVDQLGLVTAQAAGQVLIVAVHEGVAGTSSVTVIADTSPPTTGAVIVISEFMANPGAVADNTGEWLELFNPDTLPVDIQGWTLSDDGVDLHQIMAAGGSLIVPAGGYLVLGNSADSALNGGTPVAYQYANFALANSEDEIVLRDGGGNTVDRVAYAVLAGWPVLVGQSTSLDPAALDTALNDLASNWCASVTPFGAGDTGTPGAANEACVGSSAPTIQSLVPDTLVVPIGVQASLTVTVTSSQAGGVTVDVTIDNPIAIVPSTVSIPEGQTSAAIPVTGGSVLGTAVVTVSLNGSVATSTVIVTP